MIIEYFIRWGLVFLAIFTPIALGSVQPWAYTTMEIVVLFLFMAWIGKTIREGELRLARLPFLIPLFLFVLLIFLQIVPLPAQIMAYFSSSEADSSRRILITLGNEEMFGPKAWTHEAMPISVSPYATMTALRQLFSYVVVFLIVVHNIHSRKQVRFFLWVLVFTGFFISLIGIAQKFTSFEMVNLFLSGNHSPFGPFVNRNHFAGYIEMIIPLAVSLGLSGMGVSFSLANPLNVRQWAVKMGDPRVGRCITLLCLSALMATALFLSLSRGGMISFLISMAAMAAILKIKNKYGFQMKMIASFIGVIFLLVGWVGFEEVGMRISTFWNQKGVESMMIRPMIWEESLFIHKDFPMFGTGLGTFGVIFPIYRTWRTEWVTDLYAHNDYLQLLVESGYVGAILMGMSILLFVWHVLSRFANLRDRSWIPIGAGGIASGVALGIHSFVDFNLHIPANAFHFSFVMGLLVVAVNLRGGEKNQRLIFSYVQIPLRGWRRFLIGGLGVALSVLMAVAII